MNLLDALSSYAHRCKSIVELSDAPCFERQYTSITDGIADGLVHSNRDRMTAAVSEWIPDSEDPLLLVVDSTPNPRPAAKTLADRHVTHYPNPAPGNKPICVGHEYSVVAAVPTDLKSRKKHWLIPLSTERVSSSRKGHEVGMDQVAHYIDQCSSAKRLVVSVADSKYSSEYCRKRVSQHDQWVHLSRLNSTRNVYAPVEPVTGKKGRQRRYGAAMKLNDPGTHTTADETAQSQLMTHQGKVCTVKIEVWRNRLFRGSRGFKGYKHPVDLFRIQIMDESGQSLYKKPMWLCATGKERHRLSAARAFEYYACRYDIEHFFRFGKDKLLIDKYQTPNVAHEQSWWQLACLAYVQLYLARDAVTLLPKKWERYLPNYQTPTHQEDFIATPTQTQRDFAAVLEQVGTPAKPCVPRGSAKGRLKGQTQTRRVRHDIVFKNKKPAKKDKALNILDSEQTSQISESRKIKKLIKSVNTQLINLGMDAQMLYQKLIEAT